ncbi:MAG: methyltransferase domain-containing protein [Myxococcales bacterium]|nr:methyltransferase domain-containing protein [Myxococcales bacterium]
MRLQLHRLDRALLAERPADATPRTVPQIAAAAEAAIDALRRDRLARAHGPLATLSARLDAAARTDTIERMDRDDFPPDIRQMLVRRLHAFTRHALGHHRFVRMLRPVIERIAADRGRPARALELASGAGQLALALTRLAARHDLPVEITGSDIAAPFVDLANQAAEDAHLPTRFRRINAFDLSAAIEPGAIDLVFIVHAAHHFRPGQLATMIAQARHAGAAAFVAIDGRRSLRTLALLPVVMALYGSRHLIHDGFVSARKFYADAELELIARTAVPDATIEVRAHEPGYVQLTVWMPPPAP